MPDRPPDEDAPSDLLQQMLEDASREHARDIHREPVAPPPVVPELRVAETKQPSKREILLAEIDQKISAQVDEVLQHPTVQRLEAAWAGLRYLVDHVDFDENVRVALVNCSKEDLAHDFDQAIDVTVSGLYRRLCEPEHRRSDDAPVSLILADFDFDHRQQDVELLRQCAAAAADAHAPFIANASPGFLGSESPGSESPRYAAWESFRSSEDARYVALCTPGDAGLAGRESHAFAVQVADTFARRRWFDGLTDAASSAQRPKRFADTPEGRALALDSLAGAELRNVLNISRVAHFIEALGRELDVSQGASALEQALQAWLREHVPDARVSISQGDYYRYELALRAASPRSDATLRVAGTLGDA